MIIRTPRILAPILYVGIDPRARIGDEWIAASIGPAYVGIYPTEQGMEICWGILNANEAL